MGNTPESPVNRKDNGVIVAERHLFMGGRFGWGQQSLIYAPELSKVKFVKEKSGNGKPEQRYYCDVMLGKLAQKLRVYGLDVRYERSRGGMAGYRDARSESRLFITRNRRLQQLPGVLFVQSEKPAEQVEELKNRLGLSEIEKKEMVGVLSRCLICNEPLARITRDEARPVVPFFIYQIHHEFRRCPKCRRVYWPGSHVQDMLKNLKSRG
ncbi:MAG: Mut7-C RNAse domain-containing protein [bacterium]